MPILFRRCGFLFFPASIVAWLIALAAVASLVYIFIDIDTRFHSVSDTLRNFAFNALIVGLVYSILGFLFSRDSAKS